MRRIEEEEIEIMRIGRGDFFFVWLKGLLILGVIVVGMC